MSKLLSITDSNKYANFYFTRELKLLMILKCGIEIKRELHINFIANVAVNDTVNDTVFNLIKENPTITAEEIRIELNIGIATVKRKIKILKEKGIITRLGSDKTGSWKIN